MLYISAQAGRCHRSFFFLSFFLLCFAFWHPTTGFNQLQVSDGVPCCCFHRSGFGYWARPARDAPNSHDQLLSIALLSCTLLPLKSVSILCRALFSSLCLLLIFLPIDPFVGFVRLQSSDRVNADSCPVCTGLESSIHNACRRCSLPRQAGRAGRAL